MEGTITTLKDTLLQMVKNAESFGDQWKNISLGREAFNLIRVMPDTMVRRLGATKGKAWLLSQMLEQMDETSTPRFCIMVREYIQSLRPDYEDNSARLAKLRDFIDLSIPMEEYCGKYGIPLKFDPIERTEEMESVIESVEREVDENLAEARIPRGLGFCFAYWHEKKVALSRRGIEWRSPSEMNPRVIFD